MVDIIFASAFETDAADWIDPLRAAIPRARITNFHADATDTQATIAIVWNPPSNLLDRGPNIQALFNLGAGVDGILKLPGLRHEMSIFRVEDAGMATQMAEYVTYGVLRLTRHFSTYAAQSCEGSWKPLAAIRRGDWPIGVLGLGLMGTRVAQVLHGMDYAVAGWSRSSKELSGIDVFAGAKALDPFLQRTRILVNTLPLTPQTTGILNRTTLGALKPGAYVINVGRGEHLVERDLLDLLNTGHVQGAMLDVFATEPLPAEHPFWRNKQILVTPHVAASSLRDETVEQIARKVNAYLDGKPVSGAVDRQSGY